MNQNQVQVNKNRATAIAMMALLLVAITSAVYWQAQAHPFLNFDDDYYVTKNPHVRSGLTAANIGWAFTSVEQANWHPVTWISHMIDVQVYGMHPQGHHLTSVIIHILSSVLLLILLFRLTRSLWQSSCIAAVFALHPLHVESVVWVAERKDVLSAFFCFLALYFYVLYTENRSRSLYVSSLFFFIVGLMSKPMIVTLPFLMLLLDLWPLNRISAEAPSARGYGRIRLPVSLLREKMPFFVCSLLSSAITMYAHSLMDTTLNVIPFGYRVQNAVVSYIAYMVKTFWPLDLALLYPLRHPIPSWQVVGSVLLILGISIGCIHWRRRHPYLAVGWFWSSPSFP